AYRTLSRPTQGDLAEDRAEFAHDVGDPSGDRFSARPRTRAPAELCRYAANSIEITAANAPSSDSRLLKRPSRHWGRGGCCSTYEPRSHPVNASPNIIS